MKKCLKWNTSYRFSKIVHNISSFNYICESYARYYFSLFLKNKYISYAKRMHISNRYHSQINNIMYNIWKHNNV